MIENFFDWYARQDGRAPWLILGKGPSFARRSDFDLGSYRTVALNHVVREQAVDLAHVIDIEVLEQCPDAIEANARMLVMPWIPHERRVLPWVGSSAHFGPSNHDLNAWCSRLPVLGRMAGQGRLLWYNLHTAAPDRLNGATPVVKAHGFSITAVVRLLALAGARNIRTLGIDGGSRYADAFQDLSDKTRLQSWQDSFDMQFEDLAAARFEFGLDLAPLDVAQPVRVFVGAEPEQRLALEVLRYSIQRHSSMNVDVVPLHQALVEHGISIPTPAAARNRPRTPFSFQRFAIPQLVQHRGRAIYLDSDMLVFRDIRELWRWPFEGARVLAVPEPGTSGRKPQFSVMVMDCERLEWSAGDIVRQLDQGVLTYEQALYEMQPAAPVAATLPGDWNELERYREGRTALIHYTDMSRQPWLATHNPNARLWCRELLSALGGGYISRALVQDAVQAGHVRPSLLLQVDQGISDPLLLPHQVRRREVTTFAPPHTIPNALKGAMGSDGGPAYWVLRGYARMRSAYYTSPVQTALSIARKLIRALR